MKMRIHWCISVVLCWAQLPTHTQQEPGVTSASVRQLCQDLERSTLEAELLYAKYSSRAFECLKAFLARTRGLGNDTISKIDPKLLTYGPSGCRERLALAVREVRQQAHVEAEHSADNHQKFFLAHMIVHRMHLNKTSLFLKRAEGGLRACAAACASPPIQYQLTRWQRAANQELRRATDDIQHSRLSYRDLMTHASRRFGRIEKKAVRLVENAVQELYRCSNRV